MELIANIDNVKLRKPTMFIGFPGIGLIGRIVVEYLVSKTKAKKIGTLNCSFFPPLVVVKKNGVIEILKDEIFVLRTKQKDFIFFTGDVQPNLGDAHVTEQHFYFARKVVDIAKKLGVKNIYTFAGLDIGDARITKKPEVKFAANSINAKKFLESKYIKSAQEDLTISGAAGLIIAYAKENNIDGACILGETSGKLIYGDFESAKNILDFVERTYGIKVDQSDIEKEAKKITEAFKQIVTELKNVADASTKKDNGLSYVR